MSQPRIDRVRQDRPRLDPWIEGLTDSVGLDVGPDLRRGPPRGDNSAAADAS